MKLFVCCFFMLGANAIIAQELTMFNKTSGFGGFEYYQDDILIDKHKMLELMNTNAETAAYWKTANKANTTAIISGIAQLGFTIWFLVDIDDFEETSDVLSSVPFWGSIGSGIVSGIFAVKSLKNRKSAILKYNSQLEMGYNFSPSDNGLGIVMNF